MLSCLTQANPTVVSQDQAKALPLWAGEVGAEPPALCGAIPASLEYTGHPGDKVAALVREDEEENWILAEHIQYNSGNQKYEVDDVDAEEGKE